VFCTEGQEEEELIYSLESMPEIERENILASRLEEMQKFKDSQQLDAMYKMAGMGNEDEDEDDDDEPRKRRRSPSPKLLR
jgi:RNA polymerase-associated protein RTF1